jgi:acetyl-CoA/propionyl-CoA carboxylase biotin carboxyl carrier protein
MEMNTRLQVEHPVTEEVYGADLVETQLRVAAGEPAPWGTPQRRGHAVEARIYAEDPAAGFLPTGGGSCGCAARGARVDAGVAEGGVVGSAYDPMLAKVIVGADRARGAARADARSATLCCSGSAPTSASCARSWPTRTCARAASTPGSSAAASTR